MYYTGKRTLSMCLHIRICMYTVVRYRGRLNTHHLHLWKILRDMSIAYSLQNPEICNLCSPVGLKTASQQLILHPLHSIRGSQKYDLMYCKVVFFPLTLFYYFCSSSFTACCNNLFDSIYRL